MKPSSDALTFEPESDLSTKLRDERDVTENSVNTTLAKAADVAAGNLDLSNSSSRLTPSNGTVFDAPNSTLEYLNVTTTLMAPTEPKAANSTSVPTGASTEDTGGNGDNIGGIIAAVVITVVIVIAFIAAVYLYFRRRGKPQKAAICFQPIRKRRSSTSDSRRTLEELDEDPDKLEDEHPDIYRGPSNGSGGGGNSSRRPAGGKRVGQEELDTFTIDDMEDADDEVRGDEYYYDEVFGTSQFEDMATQNAVRQLYSTAEDPREEELLDFDFETLGIKIEDYKIDPTRRTVDI